MEMTIEQMENRKNYWKEWRKNNPDKVKKYSRKSREKEETKIYQRTYHQQYYIDHKEEILERTKRWREDHKGDYVYFYVNSDKINLYIGSTARVFEERQSFHLCEHSNLKMSAEELVYTYNLECILYKDFSEYNLSRDELYWIENYYIEKEGAILNKKPIKNIFEENLSHSAEQLSQISDKTEYKEFEKLDKYLN